MIFDSTGNEIVVGDLVKFRGQIYTIKEFSLKIGSTLANITFEEEQHTTEVADEFSVDKVYVKRNVE